MVLRDNKGRFISPQKVNVKSQKQSVSASQPRDANGRFLPKQSKVKQTSGLPQRDSRGRFIAGSGYTKPKKKPKKPKKPKTTQVKVDDQVTHIAILIDSSASMQWHRGKVIEVVNKQINQIKVDAAKTKQNTKVTLSTFRDRIAVEAFPESVRLLDKVNFVCAGMTPLYDNIYNVLRDWTQLKDFGDPNHAFLMIVVTDGQENDSRSVTSVSLKQHVQTALATDCVTFAVSAPNNVNTNMLTKVGIPQGCIQQWEVSEAGLEDMATSNMVGTTNYMTQRSKGVTKLDTFYVDASGIQKRDLSRLNEETSKFRSWMIPAEQDITSFVTAKAGNYVPGNAYYELMKKETVQTYKDLVLQDKKSGKIYTGSAIRGFLGLPANKDVKLEPGNHADFKIFVKSTSTNRKLVRGTTLLYRK